MSHPTMQIPEEQKAWSLKPLLSFGELIDPEENRDYEEMFALFDIHKDFLETVLTKDKHWCLDRMEIFSEDDDSEYLDYCKSLAPQDLFTASSEPLVSLILSEAGGGKTCLLHHLWTLARTSSLPPSPPSPIPVPRFTPIYATAKRIYQCYMKNREAVAENGLEFTAMMHAIAEAAMDEFQTDAAPVGGQEEILAILLGETPVLLLIDDLDLIPLEWVPVWIKFFKESATLCSVTSPATNARSGEGQVSNHSFEGRTILATRSDNFQSIQPFSSVEKMLKSVQCLELQPGFTFNFITTAQIRSLLKRWSAVRQSESVQEGASQWVAFESALRAHRRKLYPSCTHSPLLMFILARRLAKGSLNDTEKGTDRQFNIFELLDSLFSDCLREEFLGAAPADAAVEAAKRSHGAFSGSDMEASDGDSAMDVETADMMSADEESESLSKSKFPILHEHGLDIAQLKRLCALVGFLCHWSIPRSLHKETRPSRQKLANRLPQTDFICVQLKQLLSQEEISGLLGFDFSLTNQKGDEHTQGILDEVFLVLRYFYDISVDGRARVKHPLVGEFLAGKFLTEPSYWCDLIMGSLTHSIEFEGRTLSLRKFNWANSAFQTDWWWDGVYQFAGIRRGVTWLASKLLQGSVYDTKYEGSPQTNKRSTASAKETRNQMILEYYLRNLQSIGIDVEDLGQIRFQILLRVYSSICNHRTATENAADPVTEWIGKAFSGLVERSLTVFVHLEVFPNYFLSAFNSTICNNIVKRCISIFVKRSTHHAANIISKFQFSPYLKRHLPSLLEIYSRREPKTRLAIFNILRKVDEVTLEKSNIADMVQMLGDYDGNVRREVVTTLVNLGLASAAQIRQPLLNNLFVDGNPQPAISETISALTNLADCEDTMDTTPQQMLHSKHTSTITALLEQPDPGTRLLAYVCFGSPNFEHNADENNGIPARKAALHVCVRLCSDSSVPLFASGENIGTAQKMRGDYCYTVALNSLISESLGETAVCWVSSAMDLLKFKRFLIHKVSSKAFAAASEETRVAALDELLNHASYVTHGQMFEVLLLTEAEYLVCCAPRLLEYIQQHVIGKSSTSASVQVLAVKVYLHLTRSFPTLASLQVLCKILLSHPSPLVIESTLVALETLSTLPDIAPTADDFTQLLLVVQDYLRSPMHYVSTEAVKALGTLPETLMPVSEIPIVSWLQHTTGSLRQACIYLIDKHPDLFQGHIGPLCELFLSSGGLNSCFIRSAAVSALACLSRRGYAAQVVATICQQEYLDPKQQPYYVNEAAIRVLSLVPVDYITEEARNAVFALLPHRSHRVTVAVIDALGHFEHPFILEDSRMERFAACLPHDDSEIRSAASNALERLKSKFGDELNSTTARVDQLFGQYANSGIYYHRLAAVRLLTFYNVPVLKQHHDVLASLLLDTDNSVRIELLRALRDVIDHPDLFAVVKGTLVELIEQKNSRSGLESQSLREVFRLLRCDEQASREMAPYAHQSLNLYFEDVQVKKQAVLLLSLIDQLNGENVQSLVDMLKTSDAKILTEVANTFCRAGLPLVRLIPKMFGYMKGEHPTVKRKLLRFIAPFKEEVRDEYVQLYHQIITMTTDSDSVIRKKAAELLAMVACSLPSDLPDGLTNTVTNAIIEALVEICLDRNSFVRRESALSLSEIGASQPQFIAAIHRKLLKSDEDPFSNILVWRLFSFRWGVLIEKQSRSK